MSNYGREIVRAVNPPCKECENKGCGVYHSKCELYQKYLKDKEEYNKKYRKNYNRYMEIEEVEARRNYLKDRYYKKRGK